MSVQLNPYGVLGLDDSASREDIVAAYEARTIELEAARASGSAADRAEIEERLGDLLVAYHVLTAEGARARYRRTTMRQRLAAQRREVGTDFVAPYASRDREDDLGVSRVIVLDAPDEAPAAGRLWVSGDHDLGDER